MRRKPPDKELLTTIQRVQTFSAAYIERHTLHQLQKKMPLPVLNGSIAFHDPKDQLVLEYMIQIGKALPAQLKGTQFPSVILLLLWLAECRASQLGSLLEGEVKMPYPILDQQWVYKARFPQCLYPSTCLACGQTLPPKNQQMFCKSSCRSIWTTVEEQFDRISQLARSKDSVPNDYGTLLLTYSLFIHNPNYKSYPAKKPEIAKIVEQKLNLGIVTLYQNDKGEPVDLQGNKLPNSYLITDIEDVLP